MSDNPTVTVYKFMQSGRKTRHRRMSKRDAQRFCALPSSKGPGWFYGWMAD